MDQGLAYQTFSSLRSGKPSLNDVETAVAALVKSLGFESTEAMTSFTASPITEEALPSDQAVLADAKRKRLAEMMSGLPSSDRIMQYAGEYQAAEESALAGAGAEVEVEVEERVRLEHVVAVTTEMSKLRLPLIQPMAETPCASVQWKKYVKRLPARYDPAPLYERSQRLEEAIKAADGIRDAAEKQERKKALSAEVIALDSAMGDLVRQAIDYWEKMVQAAARMKAVATNYRQEVETLRGGQLAEATRAIDETLDCLRRAHDIFLRIPILVAEAYRSGGEVEMVVAGAINRLFSRLTCRPGFDYYAMLRGLVSLPKNPTSVAGFLQSIGGGDARLDFPPEHIAVLAGATKREQLVGALATLVYFML